MRTFDLFTSSKMQLRYVLCAATLATCVSTAIHAEIIHGRVDRVIDGDTLQVITADDEIRVRIRGIDAPEADQEFGGEARIALDKLVNGRAVILNAEQKDRYGRVLASVAVNGNDVGLFMLERGYAWFYATYGLQIPAEWRYAYKTAEADARANKIGLWQSPGSVPPWAWRKSKREADKALQQEHRESLEGITEELQSNLQTLESNLSDLRDQFFSDNVEVSEKDKALEKEPDEPLHWWELFAKLGEGMSRWFKAFITAQF